jgi:hypothetical protein
MTKRPTISIGAGFRLTPDGKIVADESAKLAKLDVSKRLNRKKSKRVRVVKKSGC